MSKESMIPHLSADDVFELVPMTDAVSALNSAFKQAPSHHHRSQVPLGEKADVMFMMPAVAGPSAGVKIVSIASGNTARGLPLVNGIYILLDRATGVPTATLDGAALTNLRTPAISAVATDLLAKENVTTVGIFGTGVQAQHHITAMLAVRPNLTRILIAGRTIESAQKFIDGLGEVEIEMLAATPSNAAASDVVCGCTSAFTPVIPTNAVLPGAHLNLVGSYSAERREVDLDLIMKSTVFVDDREAAAVEAGEVIHAVSSGAWTLDDIAGDLIELTSGRASRAGHDEITLFKSVGLSVEDLVIASLAAQRAGIDGVQTGSI